ncbi:sialidase family protein [Lysinibacillus xylanilyticus]|uniref:sialidase family protein n=1 Tax=Lysinibacillus xylanilyticus TaxID=582475 RepID=UPI003D042DD2
MKQKVKSLLGTTKKRVVFTAAFAVLVVGAGTGGVYAASSPSKSVEIAQNKDGSFRYTNDSGKTWKNGLPEGAKATKNADGSETVSGSVQAPNYSAADFGTGVSIRTRTDANGGNGEFSTDGGKTWSKEVSAGLKELDGAQLSPNVQLEIKQKDDGSFQYTTDGGKTWKDGLPEGAKATKNADGSETVSGSVQAPNYSAADFGTGVSIRTRTDANGGNGEFSTDGGKTWSKEVSAGLKELDGAQLSPNVQLEIKQKDDGSFQYTTDGGKTWKDGLPEGAKAAKNADGSETVSGSVQAPNYSAADFGTGVSIRTRTDANGRNGEFSTDGGKTWSKEVPAGLKFQEKK